jgi:protein-tyrosine phosphatase
MKTISVGLFYGYIAEKISAKDDESSMYPPSWVSIVRLILLQACLANIFLGVLFRLRIWAWVVGKTPRGVIPLWSYILWWGFHLGNAVFVRGAHYFRRLRQPKLLAASEVVPGFYVGGWFVDEIEPRVSARRRNPRTEDEALWAAVVDLTTELPERSRAAGGAEYLNLPVWDGNAPSIKQMDRAAAFVGERFDQKRGNKTPIVIHCAFGVGRSVTVACACLVATGVCTDVDAAFCAIKRARPCARLNAQMSTRLKEWERLWRKDQ